MKPKIDLFYNGDYLCSTNQSKTCREAKTRYLKQAERFKTSLLDRQIAKHPEYLKAFFDKEWRKRQ